MPEEFRTFLWFDVVEDFVNGAPERFPEPGGGLPEPVLDLGECLLDRVRVRTEPRQGGARARRLRGSPRAHSGSCEAPMVILQARRPVNSQACSHSLDTRRGTRIMEAVSDNRRKVYLAP